MKSFWLLVRKAALRHHSLQISHLHIETGIIAALIASATSAQASS